MEALPRTASHLHSPVAAFPTEPPVSPKSQESTYSKTTWGESHLNPLNRIDSLTPIGNPRWRIDGCARLGTQFYAIPLFFRTLPRSVIHLFIPEHSAIPHPLRRYLELSTAFSSTSSSQVAGLGITRHILQALEHWTENYPPLELEKLYKTLPFGSFLVFENVVADVKEIRIRFVATHDLERQLLSQKDLLALWGTEVTSHLPPPVDISCLQLISQLHDTVSLVQRLDVPGSEPVILKTQPITPQFLYQELKVILTLPPHLNIVPSPLNLVTKRCRFGNSVVIVGFTIKYFSRGSLSSIVLKSSTQKEPDLLQKTKWASQITHALIHLVKNGAVHTDLRLDNIVLSDTDDVILIDHEQKGVWHALAPPEVNYLNYLHELAFSSSSTRIQYRKLIEPFTSCIPPQGKRYQNPPQGYNFPFAVLHAWERESAEVYLLGQTLWCLFEGIDTAEPYYGKASPMDDECLLRFPDFCHTPMELRGLIERCTDGRLGQKEKFPIVRKGGYFVSRSEAEHWAGGGEDVGFEGEGREVEEGLKSLARGWWSKQIEEMKAFVTDRARVTSGMPFGGGAHEPRFIYDRPKLQEVLGVIEGFREKFG